MEKALIVFSIFLNIMLTYKYVFNKGIAFAKNIKNFIKTKSGEAQHLLVNSPIVYIAKETEAHYLSPCTNQDKGESLPSTLVIKPGNYLFQDESYELKQEGLCRLMLPEHVHEQRIIFAKDVAALMSSLAWIMTHGDVDEHLSYQDALAKATQSKLQINCQTAAKFAFELLTELSIQSRIVSARTLEQWNTYDDGHYLIEVYRADLGKWVLYDLDHDVYFTCDGLCLSFLEFMDHLPDNYQIQYISSDIRVSIANSHVNYYDLTFINEGRIANLKHWYKRIMQLAFIEHNDENFSHHEVKDEILKTYPRGAFPKINFIPRMEFVNRFYLDSDRKVNHAI